MADYSKQWSSATPGYLIFLVDQSNSMSEPWKDGNTFAKFTSDVINQTINELIATNAAGETVKNRVFISLIGYGGSDSQPVENLRSDYLSEYADKPIRIEKSNKYVSDGAGGQVKMEFELPIFIEPKAGGWTPMGKAFDLAKQLIQSWVAKKSDNPVPVIINVSDGKPQVDTNAGTVEEVNKTIEHANEIMKIQTSDGAPLIFNVHIAKGGKEIQFPESEEEFKGDEMAELLFRISSKV
ncbi:MAG: hypothetical protein ACXVC7_17535, partial [Bacteroidia bacterium]